MQISSGYVRMHNQMFNRERQADQLELFEIVNFIFLQLN